MKKDMWILLVILIGATVLRVKLVPLNFFHDEVYTAMAVKGVLKTGIPQMESGLIYNRAFPLTYLMAIPAALAGVSEQSIRLVPLLLGLVSIVTVYAFLKKETSRSVALSAAIVMALSPWHIFYSIFARSFMAQSLLFFIVVWGLYNFIEYESRSWIVISALSVILLALLSPIAILALPVVMYALLKSKTKIHWHRIKTPLVLYSLGFILAIVLPTVIPAWEPVAGNNPYSLLTLNNFILPNMYFFRTLFEFMPLGFILLIASVFYFWRKKSLYIFFPFFVLSSFIVLSVLNPFHNLQPRYLSNFMVVTYVSIGLLMFKMVKKRVFFTVLMLMILATDVITFPSVLGLDYGSPTKGTLQVSRSWDEFQDIKSGVEYVNERAGPDDLIITLQPRGQTEVYANRLPDYYLRTVSYQHEGHNVGDMFIDDYSNIPLITSVSEFETILTDAKAQSKRIWVISSKSERPELEHIDQKTYNLLIKSGEIVYTGHDQYHKVYIIRPS